MNSVEQMLAANRGVASWRLLKKAGMTRTELHHALKNDDLKLVRRGWYAIPTADATVKSAVKAGGVCSCLSALKLHGVWLPKGDSSTHTRARSSAHNCRGAHKQFCRRHGRPLPEDGSVDDVPTALAHAVRCLPPEGLVVVMDSVMNLGLMSKAEIKVLLKPAPEPVRALLKRTAKAESGTESMTRFRLAGRGVKAKTQVKIPEVGRVDLLVGKRLIIEVDGEEYHASTKQFHKDRERDLAAHELGYLPIRLTYRQVADDWAKTEKSLLAVIRRGEHLRALPDAKRKSEPAVELP